MSRVFSLEEASTHESRPFTTSTSAEHESDGTRRIVSGSQFRRRLQSLSLAGRSSEIPEDMQAMSQEPLQNSDGHGEGKKVGGIRSLMRRASISIKNRQRRHSHAVEERPQSAWNRLRTATSFNRHSKFLPASSDFDAETESSDVLHWPIPGCGNQPPLIPRGYGGAAARATAAAQNEYLLRNRQFLFPNPFDDHESGIGIAITRADSMDFVDVPVSNVITRVDFIAKLPTELAIQILENLDYISYPNAALVSRKWAEISSSQHVLKKVFMREQSKTFATSQPIALGAGLGLPNQEPNTDWKGLFRIREELRRNWMSGSADAVYLNGHLDSVYCVQFDENKLITGSRDKTIRVWDMNTYMCTLVIGPPDVFDKSNTDIMLDEKGRLRHFAQMPDKRRFAESTPKAVSFPMYHNKSILCLQFDEEILVTGSSDGSCIVYDIKSGYQPIRRLQYHTEGVLDLAFDKRFIVTCSKDTSICVWDRASGAMLKRLTGHRGPVNSVQMRGNTIVSCSGDYTVKLWNIDSGKNIKELAGHTKGLACSQFSEDSKLIASAGNDRIIRIWDANTGECLKKINAHDDLIRSLHIDSISGRLISSSYDQDIKVFDMATGSLLLDFPRWHEAWVLEAKSDYRRIISTGSIPTILIMDFGMSVKGIEKLKSRC